VATLSLDKNEICEIMLKEGKPMSNKDEVALIATNDSVTFILDGEVFTGTREYAEKAGFFVAYKEKAFQKAAEILNKAKAVVRRSLGAFTVEDGIIYHDGLPVHNTVASRIIELSDAGLPFMSAVNFLAKLLLNTSNRSVSELYEFLEHKNLPLTEDGDFLAYKTVQSDFLSKASGREPVEVSTDGGLTWKTFIGKIPNNVGNIVRMKRNLVNDDREQTCSVGLHVGSLEYAGPQGWYHSYGDVVLIVKVNPKNAVSVPSDHNAQKLRVSEYEVLSIFKGAYESPLASNDGSEFGVNSDTVEVYCDEDYDGCGWEGSYAELDRGYRCPDCGEDFTIFAIE